MELFTKASDSLEEIKAFEELRDRVGAAHFRTAFTSRGIWVILYAHSEELPIKDKQNA